MALHLPSLFSFVALSALPVAQAAAGYAAVGGLHKKTHGFNIFTSSPSVVLRLRMLIVLALLLGLVAPARAVSVVLTSTTLDPICNGLKGLDGCKTVITVPTGVKVKTCKNKFVKWNKCKTKTKYNYPCPTWRKPGRTCAGWTCIPGTDETQIDTPCGITVLTKKVNLCKAVTDNIPGINNLLSKATGVCNCMPQILFMVNTGILKELASNANITATGSSALLKFGKAQQCIIDNGFAVQDNRAKLSSYGADLERSNRSVIFQAAEIDLATYIRFGTSIAPCFTPAGCNLQLMESFFTTFLDRSEKLMSEQLLSFLTPWKTALGELADGVQKLGMDLESIPSEIKKVEGEIEGIVKEVCTNPKLCVDEVFINLQNKVSETLFFADTLAQLQGSISDTVSNAIDSERLVSPTIESISSLSDLNEAGIAQLIESIRSINDLADRLQAVKQLPQLLKSLESIIPKLIKFVNGSRDGRRRGRGSCMLVFPNLD